MTYEPAVDAPEFARRILKLIEDFRSEMVLVDTMLVLVKMLNSESISHAVLYATGDAFKFGALEFGDAEAASSFLSQISDDVAYASYIDGVFEVYRYPYFSRVLHEWVFLEFQLKSETRR
jgi:hypothetical protein